jgi:hypothetical protein
MKSLSIVKSLRHRVDRVLGFFSSRPNWDLPPIPSPAGEYVPPFGSGGGETHSLTGEGVGGPNSDEGTDTVVLYRYFVVWKETYVSNNRLTLYKKFEMNSMYCLTL